MEQQSEPIKMNFSAVAVSTLGFVSALFTCFMNIILLKTHIKKKNDMTLFYYRFALDVIMGALLAVFLLLAVLYSSFYEHFSEYQNLIFYFSLPGSNVAACRSIVALSVAIERMVAAYAPIFFHNYRQHFPTVIILILAVIFGLTEDVVLYGFCDFHLNMSKNCAALGCAINSCFFNYWTTHKAVNRLALIDAAIVCMFDYLPNFIAKQISTTQFFSYENIGPYGAVAKMLGCAIEAFLVFRTMRKGKGSKISENSRSSSRHLKHNITKV
ncbi:unnamed protein product [Caenorhabditis nigoni]